MASIKKNYFYNTLLSISNILMPLVTYPYVLRIIGPEGIGKVNFSLSVMGYFLLIAQIGIPLYGIKEIAKVRDDSEKLSRTFSELFFLNVATSVIAVAVYASAVFLVPKFRADSVLFAVVGLTLAVNIFSIDWFYSGVEEYKYITLRSLGVRLLYIVMVFVFIRTGDDYVKYAALGVATLVAGNAVNVFFLLKRVKLRFRGLQFARYFKPMAMIFLAGIIGSIYNKIDVVLLGFMAEEKHVGYYTTNRRITALILAFVTSLGTVLIPRLSYYLQKGMKDEYNKMAERSVNFIYFLSAPAIALIFVMSDEIMLLFGGDRFIPASFSLKIVSFQVLVTGLAVFFGTQVILAHNDEKSLVLSNFSGAVVNVAINLLLVRAFLHNAPAIAIVASETAVVATQVLLARRYIGFRIFSAHSLNYFLGGLIVLAASYAVKHFLNAHFAVILVTGAAVSAVAYILLLAACKDPNLALITDYLKGKLVKKIA